MSAILWFLIIGAVVGFLAGLIMRGRGFGILGNIIVGILGSVIGRYIFGYFNITIASGILGFIIIGVIGAVVLLFIIGIFSGKN